MKFDFSVHGSLNPDFWNGLDLKPEVRKKLIQISLEFHKFLKIKAKVKDVIITGSSANFNYSKEHSDLDLHLIYDFDDVLNETKSNDDVILSEKDLVEEYVNSRKTIWNDTHDIKIKNTSVELYAQDQDANHVSQGTFSILKNKWMSKPSKTEFVLDKKNIIQKSKFLMKSIDDVIKNKKDPADIKLKIKDYRQSGLNSEGEFSTENIVYKVLRRSNYIQKLYDYDVDRTNKKLSL